MRGIKAQGRWWQSGWGGRCLGLVFMVAFLLPAQPGADDKERNPVPFEAMTRAEPTGHTDIRAIGLSLSPALQADFEQSLRDETDEAYCPDENGAPAYCTLSLSGGAGYGAFAAGFINGWTDSGTRPVFKVVTGISTGALAAPFAFVGPKYDFELKASFTTINDDDVYKANSILAVFKDESFADTAPLANLIATWIDEGFLKDVAAAHAAGRRLIIGTTNMDRQEFVLWNMGAIASSEDPDKLELFRQVMLASASIPGMFPPVYIDVEVDGVKYDEMHSDGSVFAPVFFHAFVIDPKAARDKVFAEDGRARPQHGQLYVIRAGKIYPEPEHIERGIKPIVRRAIATAIKVMALSSLYFIYTEAQAADMEFNYVSVPGTFTWEGETDFDTAEMNRLYQVGYDMAGTGYEWEKAPPQFSQSPLAKIR